MLVQRHEKVTKAVLVFYTGAKNAHVNQSYAIRNPGIKTCDALTRTDSLKRPSIDCLKYFSSFGLLQPHLHGLFNAKLRLLFTLRKQEYPPLHWISTDCLNLTILCRLVCVYVLTLHKRRMATISILPKLRVHMYNWKQEGFFRTGGFYHEFSKLLLQSVFRWGWCWYIYIVGHSFAPMRSVSAGGGGELQPFSKAEKPGWPTKCLECSRP